MPGIRAFVAHSFLPQDASLVSSFTAFLDNLAEYSSSFSWEDASPAEPKELADKVLERLRDKTLLIAICTRKEYAAEPSDIRMRGVIPRFFGGPFASFQWKASDWIIQEIGIAIGRGIRVCPLLEEGVRQPGDIQGNLERISFSREAPEKAQAKVLQMITSMQQAVDNSGTDGAQTSPLPEKPDEPVADAKEEWEAPSSTWDRAQYEHAYLLRILYDKPDADSTIGNAYLASPDGSDPHHRLSWQAFAEWARLAFEKGGTLEKLKQISATDPSNTDALTYLARGFAKHEQLRESAATFEAAAETTTSAKLKLALLRQAALTYQRATESDKCAAVIATMMHVAGDPARREDEVLEARQAVSALRSDKEVELAARERLVTLHPDDTERRFALAFAHGDAEQNELALLHYLRIPTADRKGVTWNNMGVAFDSLSLPAKSVEAYQKAATAGETLAMANIAYKYISAGFVDEARKRCEEATALPTPHKNVTAAIRRLDEIPEDEEKRASEALERARRVSLFYSDCGSAMVRIGAASFKGRWEGPSCVLSLTVTHDTFEANGSYEAKSLGFGDLLTGRLVRHTVRYSGQVVGSAAFGVVTRHSDGGAYSTTLGGADGTFGAMLFLSPDGQVIRVLERRKGSAPTYYELKRLTESTSSPT